MECLWKCNDIQYLRIYCNSFTIRAPSHLQNLRRYLFWHRAAELPKKQAPWISSRSKNVPLDTPRSTKWIALEPRLKQNDTSSHGLPHPYPTKTPWSVPTSWPSCRFKVYISMSCATGAVIIQQMQDLNIFLNIQTGHDWESPWSFSDYVFLLRTTLHPSMFGPRLNFDLSPWRELQLPCPGHPHDCVQDLCNVSSTRATQPSMNRPWKTWCYYLGVSLPRQVGDDWNNYLFTQIIGEIMGPVKGNAGTRDKFRLTNFPPKVGNPLDYSKKWRGLNYCWNPWGNWVVTQNLGTMHLGLIILSHSKRLKKNIWNRQSSYNLHLWPIVNINGHNQTTPAKTKRPTLTNQQVGGRFYLFPRRLVL